MLFFRVLTKMCTFFIKKKKKSCSSTFLPVQKEVKRAVRINPMENSQIECSHVSVIGVCMRKLHARARFLRTLLHIILERRFQI